MKSNSSPMDDSRNPNNRNPVKVEEPKHASEAGSHIAMEMVGLGIIGHLANISDLASSVMPGEQVSGEPVAVDPEDQINPLHAFRP